MKKNILMNAITPHPPIIIPEVGGNELKKVEATVSALQKLCSEIVGLNPDTVVILTPHSSMNPYFFSIYSGQELRGNFAKFRAPEVSMEFNNDMDFAEELNVQIKKDLGRLNFLPPGVPLDHGSGVPLYYLDKAGFKNKVVVINYTALGKREHNLFGKKIAETAKKLNRKIVFIASGDLSHKLIPNAPAGFDEGAHKFDELIVKSIAKGDYKAIMDVSPELREIAGECGYNSIMVAFGITGGEPLSNQVLSYEAPFGVGYIVAKL